MQQFSDIERTLQLVDPDTWALFLDIDGTIVDIAPTPDLVVAEPDLIVTLVQLSLLFKGAVAIVTGRQIEDADRILAPLQMVAAGVHGGQIRRRAGGSIETVASTIAPGLLQDVAELVAVDSGILIENKITGIAVHYRHAPRLAATIERRLRHLVQNSAQAVTLCRGPMVFEVLPAESSKHAAVKVLARLPAFEGRRPLFIGDDRPDETAFAAAVARGGRGMKVAGEHFPRGAADFSGPAHVRQWLRQLARRH
jgi:trehalose 6-phosphate phosphatase